VAGSSVRVDVCARTRSKEILMPVEMPSGHLISTNEYIAILSDISDFPTTQLPTMQFKPLAKKPLGTWRPPADATECLVQHCKIVDQSRTFFGINGYKRTLENASPVEFCLFLEDHGYDTHDYDEPTVPAMVRRDAVNTLLDRGRLLLLRTGEGGAAKFYLAAPVGCRELAWERLWDSKAYCCPACHSIGGTLTRRTLIDRRDVMLCCRADRFIDDFPNMPQKLPPCEWWADDDSPPVEWDPNCLDD